MKKMKFKCNVIVCGPAVGKTYLAERDNRFVDLDEIKSNYKYGLQNATREEKEKGKLNRGQVIQNYSTQYAIKLLQEEIRNNKIILLSYNAGIIKYIIENKIKYCLVYAGKDLSMEYASRMKQRGNNIKFIEEMTNENVWEQFYINNENDLNATYKVELRKGQYLSDIKDMFVD